MSANQFCRLWGGCVVIAVAVMMACTPGAKAVLLNDTDLYTDPWSVPLDYYPEVYLPDLSSVNSHVWDAGTDPVTDADVLPVLRGDFGPYPSGYVFSQADYLQQPNVDYCADLTGGTLTFSTTASAQYMVRVTRESGTSQLYAVFAETDMLGLGGDADPAGAVRKIPGPNGEVNIVATGDSVVDRAAANIAAEGKNVTRATGVQDAINKIQDAARKAGRPIHVELVGHGAPGMISLNDKSTADGDLIGPDAEDIQEFQNALDGFVSGISLFSCRSAKGDAGLQLLTILADSLDWASGFTVPVTVETGYFNVDLTAEPLNIPEPGTLGLMALSALAMLLRRRR